MARRRFFFFSNSIYYGTLCGRPYDLELCMGLQFMRQCPAHAHVKESKNSTGNGVIDWWSSSVILVESWGKYELRHSCFLIWLVVQVSARRGLIMPSRCGSMSRLVAHILLRSKAQLGCRFVVTSTVLLVGHQIVSLVGRSTFVRISSLFLSFEIKS